MFTEILAIDAKKPDSSLIDRAADVIKQGGLVAFPTETVYGLGANAFDGTATKAIYEAKGRPSDNPLIVHIADKKMLNDICASVPEDAVKLANAFWPGPLTLIVQKSERIPAAITGGRETVAVRMPSHPIARMLIERSQTAIAAPSANRSGRPSPSRFSHVYEDLNRRIDMIIDGGDVPLGLESTIVDVSDATPKILRLGFLTKRHISETLNKPVIGPKTKMDDKTDTAPKAPGMKYQHYAPKAKLSIVFGKEDFFIQTVKNRLIMAKRSETKAAVIGSEEQKEIFCNVPFYSLGSRNHPEEIAHNLYDILHQLDADGIEEAYTESFYDLDIGDAIMDRLERAAAFRIIRQE